MRSTRGTGVSWLDMDDAAPLVTVTDAAREKILEVRAGEPDPDALALWLEVSGAEGATYTYDMYFQRLDEAGSDDGVDRHDDLSIVIPQASLDKTRAPPSTSRARAWCSRTPTAPARRSAPPAHRPT
jgi:Fe-S cluster assembly iron-binding protein IscA